MIDLDGLRMNVSATAANGIVNDATILTFHQRARRVWARYSGGRVTRGWLVGIWDGAFLAFRYAQVERDAGVHGGRSRCDVTRLADGRVRIVEHFEWATREGAGTNVFDELRE